MIHVRAYYEGQLAWSGDWPSLSPDVQASMVNDGAAWDYVVWVD